MSGNTPVATATSGNITVNAYTADTTVTGYVGNDTTSYYLGEIENGYGETIIDQIDNYLYNKTNFYSYYYDANIQFLNKADTIGSVTANVGTNYTLSQLGNVAFKLDRVLTSTDTTRKASFNIQITPSSSYNYTQTPVVITITLTVDDYASTTAGDIPYTAAVGDDVPFDVRDFEDFYYEKTSGGSLDYVIFSSPSNGVLYSSRGKVSASGAACYVDPTGNQTDLNTVYFSPTGTAAKNAGTVKFSFTAYGTRGTTGATRQASGTVSITYLNGSAKDITYTVGANNTVSLNASDFTAAYKEVTGKAAPTGMTIVFQSAPTNGTLTYTDSSRSNAKEVTLNSRNIKNYSFTTRTSGSSQLGDVLYTGSGSKTDTIEYIAYSGNTPQFTGKVVLSGKAPAPTNLLVPFTCYGSTGVSFTTAAFTSVDATAMASAAYVRFGVPGKGTLTYAGSSGSGVSVYLASLSLVTYKPNPGFNGTDTVTYIAYDTAGNVVASGTVRIVVSGNTDTTTPGTSSGVTSVDQFTDVPNNNSTAWYRSQLADLVSKGIMKGKGDGKFDPTGKVKNGEALKMVLLAAGYPTQTEPSGNDWAINYKNLAVSNGLISSSVVLTADISRDAVAELAARALGLSPVTTGTSPFVDSNNGYAIALYNAGIIKGDTSSGSRKFLGSDTLQRAEICVIIHSMNTYVANRYASTRPDGV